MSDHDNYRIEKIGPNDVPKEGFVLDSGDDKDTIIVRDIKSGDIIAQGKNIDLDLLVLAEQCYLRKWEETENLLKRAITD